MRFFPHALLRKAQQLTLLFGQRKEVQRPGSRGGHGYYDEHGRWQYGDRPTPVASPPEPARAPLTLTAPENIPGTSGRPAAAKASYEPGTKDYEVLEPTFIAKQIEREGAKYRRCVEGWQQALPTAQGKRQRREAELALRYWQEQLVRFERGDIEHLQAHAGALYRKIVTSALSKGEPVPAEVIAQSVEFVKARDARARYDKGRHTSFGNLSAAVNASMVEKRGYKVKRQDGTAIPRHQIDEIAAGVDAVESVIGSLADLMRSTQLTIAHTNGKHPFLRKSGGVFVPGEFTVSVGITGCPALAHELAHWLDYAAGRTSGVNRTIYGAWGSGRKPRSTTSLAEDDMAREDTPGRQLIRDARRTINDTYAVERLFVKKLESAPGQSADTVHMRVALGPYWREPAEVFARLVEQYVATKREAATAKDPARRQGSSFAHSPASWYEQAPGWWTKAEFARLMPAVEGEIQRRLAIARGQAQGSVSEKPEFQVTQPETPAQGEGAHHGTMTPLGLDAYDMADHSSPLRPGQRVVYRNPQTDGWSEGVVERLHEPDARDVFRGDDWFDIRDLSEVGAAERTIRQSSRRSGLRPLKTIHKGVLLFRKGISYEDETARIREACRTAAARRRHRFRPARWTHPNGHPRCRLCGDEERIGGWCSGKEGLLAKARRLLWRRLEPTPTELVKAAAAGETIERTPGPGEDGAKQPDRGTIRKRLASRRAAIERDLFYLDEEDLPALAAADPKRAELMKARGAMMGELLAITAALQRMEAVADPTPRLARALGVPTAEGARSAGEAALLKAATTLLKAKRREVQHPGELGGRGYFNRHGRWVYGVPPSPAAALPGPSRFPLRVLLRRQPDIVFRGQHVTDLADIAAAFKAITDLDRERLYSVALGGDGRVQAIECVSIGSVTATLAVPREILKAPIALGARQLVLVHNHPAGMPTPSANDRAMLANLRRVAMSHGISIGGLVVGREGWADIDHADAPPRPFAEPPSQVDRHLPLAAEVRLRAWPTPLRTIGGPSDLASLARTLDHGDHMVAVLLDNRDRVLGTHLLGGMGQEDAVHLARLAVVYSAARVAVVIPATDGLRDPTAEGWADVAGRLLHQVGLDPPDRNRPAHALLDAVLVDRAGRFRSLLYGMEGFAKALLAVLAGRNAAHQDGFVGHGISTGCSRVPYGRQEAAQENGLVTLRIPHGVDGTHSSPSAQAPLLFKSRKLHFRRWVDGLPISIENQAGSIRHWRDHDGTEGQTRMQGVHYGYVRGTLGWDGDHLDVFLGPLARSGQVEGTTVYVVRTRKPPTFRQDDEEKAMVGFASLDDARAAFLAHYSNDPRFIARITALPWAEFKAQARQTRRGIVGEQVASTGGVAGPVAKSTRLLFFGKAHIRAFQRTTKTGQTITVEEHDDKRAPAQLKMPSPRRAAAPAAPTTRAPGGSPSAPSAGAGAPASGEQPPAPVRATDIPHEELAAHIAGYRPILKSAITKLAAAFPGIEVAGRLKETASLAEKLQRKGKGLEEIEDLAGARITFGSIEEQRAAAERVKRLFNVRSEDDYLSRGHPSGSGYRRYHLILEVEGRPVELQLSTARQTSWSDYCHHAVYKAGGRVPPEIVAYTKQVADYFFCKDGGGEAACGTMPDCPPIAQTYGCIGGRWVRSCRW